MLDLIGHIWLTPSGRTHFDFISGSKLHITQAMRMLRSADNAAQRPMHIAAQTEVPTHMSASRDGRAESIPVMMSHQGGTCREAFAASTRTYAGDEYDVVERELGVDPIGDGRRRPDYVQRGDHDRSGS